jgi:hypothetical protein
MIRTTTKKVRFGRRFRLGSSGEVLPPGIYEVETDEELLEGISFPVFRRILTLLHLQPRLGVRRSLSVNPEELDAALRRDRTPDESPNQNEGDSKTLKSSAARRQATRDRRAIEPREDDGMKVHSA